jgi:hypothetical protein
MLEGRLESKLGRGGRSSSLATCIDEQGSRIVRLGIGGVGKTVQGSEAGGRLRSVLGKMARRCLWKYCRIPSDAALHRDLLFC